MVVGAGELVDWQAGTHDLGLGANLNCRQDPSVLR